MSKGEQHKLKGEEALQRYSPISYGTLHDARSCTCYCYNVELCSRNGRFKFIIITNSQGLGIRYFNDFWKSQREFLIFVYTKNVFAETHEKNETQRAVCAKHPANT